MEMKIGIQSIPEKTELNKLIDKLFTSDEDTGDWEVVPMSMFEGLPQVIFYDNAGNRVADAVCHWGSYGHEKGLIEVMGYPLCHDFDDDVEGWLTADTVFSRWMNYLEGRRKLSSLFFQLLSVGRTEQNFHYTTPPSKNQ